jgi:hypothetical protein
MKFLKKDSNNISIINQKGDSFDKNHETILF